MPGPELLAAALGERLKAPLAVVLGSPRQAADLAGLLDDRDSVCFQLDLYQAERVRKELIELGCEARVETLADLWDLPAEFQTVVFPAQRGGERSLKILSWCEQSSDDLAADRGRSIHGECR